jgi:hypothetical protein
MEEKVTNNVLKEKLNIIKGELKEKAMEDSAEIQNIQKKITSIESKYVLLPPETIIDPKVMTEVNEILGLIHSLAEEKTNTAKTTKTNSTWEIDFLKDSITKTVQSLCQLPVPIPNNFDKTSYNTFITSTSKEIIGKIGNADSKNDLIDIISALETQKIGFIQEQTRQKLLRAIDILKHIQESNDLEQADTVIIDLAISKIKKLEITEQTVDFIIDSFSKYIPKTDISIKDMNILHEVFTQKNPTMFKTIANIIGLSANDANILYENMVLHDKQKENSKALQAKLILPAKYKHLIL